MNDQRDFEVILNSRFPLVAVETHEETRLITMVERVANIRSHALFVWSLTDGLRRRNHSDLNAVRGATPQTQDLEGCLRHIYATPQNGIYVLLARIFTTLYFAFFILLPFVSKADGNGPVPDRVTYHAH